MDQPLSEEIIQQTNKPKSEKGKKRKIVLNISILLILIGAVMYVLFKDDFSGIMEILGNSNPYYITLIFVIGLVILFVDGLIYLYITRLYKKDYKFYQAQFNSMNGFFFSGITPLASGGQPFQAFLYKKQGVSISNAISVLFIYFFFYQAILLIIGLFGMIFQFDTLSKAFQDFKMFGMTLPISWIIIISFALLVVIFVGLLLLTYSKFLERLLAMLLRLLHKIKIIKDIEKWQNRIKNETLAVRAQIKFILTNYKASLIITVLFLIRALLVYSIPQITFYALNYPIGSGAYLDTVFMANYISIFSGVLPLPGGTGGIELIYSFMFSGYIDYNGLINLDIDGIKNVASGSLVLWRTSTFYMPMLLSAFVVVFYKSGSRKKAMEDVYNITEKHLFDISAKDHAEPDEKLEGEK